MVYTLDNDYKYINLKYITKNREIYTPEYMQAARDIDIPSPVFKGAYPCAVVTSFVTNTNYVIKLRQFEPVVASVFHGGYDLPKEIVLPNDTFTAYPTYDAALMAAVLLYPY